MRTPSVWAAGVDECTVVVLEMEGVTDADSAGLVNNVVVFVEELRQVSDMKTGSRRTCARAHTLMKSLSAASERTFCRCYTGPAACQS